MMREAYASIGSSGSFESLEPLSLKVDLDLIITLAVVEELLVLSHINVQS